VTAPSVALGVASPHLDYDLYLYSSGEAKVDVVVAPTLNFIPGHGLRFAVSLDGEAPHVEEYVAGVGEDKGGWAASVLDGVRHVISVHTVDQPGHHVLTFWMIDPGVVLERIVVDLGGVHRSYLGAPESVRAGRVTPGPGG
jgi:hypothetical protein